MHRMHIACAWLADYRTCCPPRQMVMLSRWSPSKVDGSELQHRQTQEAKTLLSTRMAHMASSARNFCPPSPGRPAPEPIRPNNQELSSPQWSPCHSPRRGRVGGCAAGRRPTAGAGVQVVRQRIEFSTELAGSRLRWPDLPIPEATNCLSKGAIAETASRTNAPPPGVVEVLVWAVLMVLVLACALTMTQWMATTSVHRADHTFLERNIWPLRHLRTARNRLT